MYRTHQLCETWQQMCLIAKQTLIQPTKSSFFSHQNQDTLVREFLASFSKEALEEWRVPEPHSGASPR